MIETSRTGGLRAITAYTVRGRVTYYPSPAGLRTKPGMKVWDVRPATFVANLPSDGAVVVWEA
ncbi:hypothetical protein [Luteitalea sp.]|uniref:hypothetical protein n=1 Tax=Luteitalea sp. TaxID=2004800 RepID=UPI0025BD3014|nr:hypothetical protein [Luteitalea sp.]